MTLQKSKHDFARNTHRVVEISIKEPLKPIEKNAAAVALGRLGGLKGGKARAAMLSESRRREIASIAAHKRWSKEKSTQ